MANTINIPRTHMIMGLCLPLSVLLGYMLAEPLDSGSMAVVVFVLAVVLITARLTGGISLHSLGGAQPGGKHYIYILAAIVGYFALTSRRIARESAAEAALNELEGASWHSPS